MNEPLAQLLARYVELRLDGRPPTVEELCAGQPELAEELRAAVARYERLEERLAPLPEEEPTSARPAEPLPEFAGFRTIERLGQGGGGSVYKLEDLALGRLVAAKVLRPDSSLSATVADFIREARSLALFEDPCIVRLFELRGEADPPFLLMEYVDGFELDVIGPSLEFRQRARIMADVADAIHHAHELGILHRDLKPANIMLDAGLRPKILDFGLSGGAGRHGHGRGTLAYMAPEQLDAGRAIDARTDVYALGVVLYELLCGARPYAGETDDELMAAIRAGEARLPVEIQPDVPEPLMAIALKAMEREPENRYTSAREMALELHRYLDGRPVLARPSLYQSALSRRLRPHLEQIREWLRLKLIYPHEADGLMRAYDRLEAREDDWIVHSRALTFSQISLYLGAFLLLCGSLLFYDAYLLEAVSGIWRPILVLGLPLAGLNVLALLLFRRERQAVGVAFFLAAAFLLPLFLLILFQEAHWWLPPAGDPHQLFPDVGVSNRQLQIAGGLAGVWAGWLALRTRTIALSAVFTALLFIFHLTLLTDFGLRFWVEEGQWDRLAFHLAPLLPVLFGVAVYSEFRQRPWLARPMLYAGAGLFVVVIELLALDGKLFSYLGISLVPFQPADVSDPLLLDTLTAMALNGLLIYLSAWLLDRHGTRLLREPAQLLYRISPFTILEPLGYLSKVGEYSRRYDWLFLGLSLGITLLSRYRQRKSFYYAGLINTGVALYLITDHYDWFDRPAWSLVVVAVGLVILAVGYGLDARERSRRPTTSRS
ncbi:MAG: serine/threonine protein kinase [Acidobacteria bacterium]|nr:serine/threonine protein kinase [Acidobacteriota bacterium]